MTQAIPSWCSANHASTTVRQLARARMANGYAGAADRDGHVGVGQHGADHRFGLGHHLGGRAVVHRQRRLRDVVQTDTLQPLLPRLGEAVPGLRAVADDRQAAGGAPREHHLPFRVGQLLGLVDDDVRERPGQLVRPRARRRRCRSPARHAGRPRAAWSSPASPSHRRRPGRRRPRSSARCSAASTARCRRSRRDASESPSRCRAASSSGRSDSVHACGSARCNVRTSSARATARTCAGTPAPTTGRRQSRRPRAAATQC